MTKTRSKSYQSKSRELEAKEKLLLEGLDISGNKLKKVAIWSLSAGLITLLFWGVYNTFFVAKKKQKSKKKITQKPEDHPILDEMIQSLAPKIGRWILKEFKD